MFDLFLVTKNSFQNAETLRTLFLDFFLAEKLDTQEKEEEQEFKRKILKRKKKKQLVTFLFFFDLTPF